MQYSYVLRRTDTDYLTSEGYGKVAHLPCIFDSRPGYHRLGSRYLIDRGLGLWDPVTHGKSGKSMAPGDQTMDNYGHWLANFLEWADIRNIDPLICDYAEHVAGRYQNEMLSGIWSRDGTALSPKTVNLRVQQACDYLSWLADKGYREPFFVPQEVVKVKLGSAISSVGHRSKEVSRRKGTVRQPKRRLRMPKDAEVRTWLDRVYENFGPTKGLMCETVLLTAMRREEVACWRVDTLPERREDWHVPNPEAPPADQKVQVTIKFGCKGSTHGRDHGDKIGPEGTILIPLHLATRLHVYRMKDRNQALRRWVREAPTLAAQRTRIKDAVHLFIDDQTGTRINSKALYNAWTGVELPFKGWSPHLGRDWWACSVLWREMKKHEHLLKQGLDIASALLESSAMSIIRLQIQPQLRHAHDSTSMIYLQWISDMLGFNVSVQYEAEHDASMDKQGDKRNKWESEPITRTN